MAAGSSSSECACILAIHVNGCSFCISFTYLKKASIYSKSIYSVRDTVLSAEEETKESWHRALQGPCSLVGRKGSAQKQGQCHPRARTGDTGQRHGAPNG